jgi:hypothetical protein
LNNDKELVRDLSFTIPNLSPQNKFKDNDFSFKDILKVQNVKDKNLPKNKEA